MAVALLRPVVECDIRSECYSLAAGTSGCALALVEAERCGLFPQGRSDELIDHAVEMVALRDLKAGVWQGYLGVAWLLELLGGDTVDGDDANADTDRVLSADIEGLIQEERYDLFSGLAGVGLYLLSRTPRPAAVSALGLVVDGLVRLAESTADGAVWRVRTSHLYPFMQSRYPQGYLATGMAHGAAGVLSFLAAVEASPYRNSATRRLLQQTLAGLIALRGRATGARYPHMIEGDRYGASRPAWCHGDVGVAVGLLSAGFALDDELLIDEATTTARDAFNTHGLDRRLVDACLCHGSAGVAHLYRRIALATGDAVCREAARAWYDKTLADAEAALEKGPMMFFSPAAEPDGAKEPWQPLRSLLFGSSGVALVLLSALADDRAPSWDRTLGVITP